MKDKREIYKTVGENIRSIRKKRKYTQGTLGLRAGIAGVSISMLERGKRSPNLSKLIDIAEALDVPLKKLFENT